MRTAAFWPCGAWQHSNSIFVEPSRFVVAQRSIFFNELWADRYEIWESIYPTADPQGRIRRYHALADIAADQFEALGIRLNASTYGVLKNGLMNVLEGIKSTGHFPSPANVFMPRVWYWDQ